jgi:hypothetical protein
LNYPPECADELQRYSDCFYGGSDAG